MLDASAKVDAVQRVDVLPRGKDAVAHRDVRGVVGEAVRQEDDCLVAPCVVRMRHHRGSLSEARGVVGAPANVRGGGRGGHGECLRGPPIGDPGRGAKEDDGHLSAGGVRGATSAMKPAIALTSCGQVGPMLPEASSTATKSIGRPTRATEALQTALTLSAMDTVLS